MSDFKRLEKEYAEAKTTLREASYYKSEDGEGYMTERTDVLVYNFDKVKQKYTAQLHKPEKGICSVDAFWPEKTIFIEFKNGKNFGNKELTEKMRDTLLIYCDLMGTAISELRESSEFVVVYNEDNKPIREQEILQEITKDGYLQTSPSRTRIKEYFLGKAGDELLRWELGFYRGIYFAEVHTFNQRQFEKYLDAKVNEHS